MYKIFKKEDKEHQKRSLETAKRAQEQKEAQRKRKAEEQDRLIRNKIDSKIQELVKWIGIAEPVGNTVVDLVLQDKLKSAVKTIAEQLNLNYRHKK